MQTTLGPFEAFLFDMDGTIYLGDHLLPGAARMIEELRRRNIPVRFLCRYPEGTYRQKQKRRYYFLCRLNKHNCFYLMMPS